MNHITIKHAPSRGSIWPKLIALLITAHVVGMVSAVVIATRSGPIGAEPRFYEKAVEWNTTSTQRRANQALGWSVVWTLETAPGHATVTVRDAHGNPIEGATGRVEFFHRSHSATRRNADLTPVPAGMYTLAAPLDVAGVYELRLTLRRGEDLFTDVAVVQAFPPRANP